MGPWTRCAEHLLVASPALLDPNFHRAVVLVTEHTEDGAAGLVLNRPSPLEVAGAVPQLEPVVDDGEPVWVGGPVQPEAVLVLGEFLDPDDAAVPLFGSLGFPSLVGPGGDRPGHDPPAGVRGLCGLGRRASSRPRSRTRTGSSSLRSPTTRSPTTRRSLWRDVLRRKGGIYELVARMPEDPRVN